MTARYFVDENDLALAKALAELQGDVVFPGHAGLPEVPRQTLDDDWLEVIGTKGLVVTANPVPACREADVARASSARLRSDRND